jgi:hypothetical protein
MKRLYLPIALCGLLSLSGFAQGNKKKPKGFNKKADENASFLQKQWWLGFKAGTNLSKAVVMRRYAVLSPVNYEASANNKKYSSFKEFGAQAALEITFTYRQFSASLQPTYRNARFVYTNQYQWIETDPNNPGNNLILTYEQEQRIDHLVIPLVFKYEIAGNKLKPYVQLGGFAAFLINANKSVKISETVNTAGGLNEFQHPANMLGAKDLFAKKHWGLVAGAGVNYHLGNVRFNFDVQYLYGVSNITSTKNRFTNNHLSAVGDAMDDMRMNNLAISLGCLFPLRFLGSGFKSFDK